MSIAEAPTGLDPLALRLAEAAHRLIVDLELPSADLPYAIAVRMLADEDIRAGLAAVPDLADLRATVDQLRMRHRPVPIRPDAPEHVVCAATRKHPDACPDCGVLWGSP